jgi:hypothetical protein
MIKLVPLRLRLMNLKIMIKKLCSYRNYKEDELQVVWVLIIINLASISFLNNRNSIDLLMANKKISLSNLIE